MGDEKRGAGPVPLCCQLISSSNDFSVTRPDPFTGPAIRSVSCPSTKLDKTLVRSVRRENQKKRDGNIFDGRVRKEKTLVNSLSESHTGYFMAPY